MTRPKDNLFGDQLTGIYPRRSDRKHPVAAGFLRPWITHIPRPQAAKYQRHATQQTATAQNAAAVFSYTHGAPA